ncbi:MAG: GNAT family N-acetyltransferase, partial [Spirochaetales bacterium]|nr:GNAT family N-acetyltransferase [Spirochaetales bacterium]
ETDLSAEFVIRPATRADREPLLAILGESKVFTPEELEVARELIDIWLDKPGQKDYIVRTAQLSGLPQGYVCFGPTPATQSTWDLYWIAVASPLQGKGAGKKLLASAEKEILSRGGRLVVIETSSTLPYAPARGFYEKSGYTLEATIRDFYRSGDHRLIYTRRLRGY